MASIDDLVYEIKWKIKNFTKTTLYKYEELKKFHTKKFYIAKNGNKTEWVLSMEVQESMIGVFLKRIKGDLNGFNVKCTFFVNGPENKMQHKSFSAPVNNIIKWGFQNYLQTVDIFNDPSKYLKNKSLILGAKLEISEDDEMEVENSFSIADYYLVPKFSDFTFICSDGATIPVHRLILASCSPVMDEMFSIADTKNAIIKDVNGPTMLELVRYMYTGEVENIQKFAPELLYGAEKYKLNELKRLCVSTMIENLSINNAIEYLMLGEKYNNNILLRESARFIKKNFKQMQQHVDWEKIDAKLYRLLLRFFEESDSNMQSFETTL